MLFACSDPLAPASLSSGFFPPSPLLVGYIHSTFSLFFQISKLPCAPGSLPALLPLQQFLLPLQEAAPHFPPFPHICGSGVTCESPQMPVVLGHPYKPGTTVHGIQ